MFYMDASTLSRNVDRMRQRGWLAASPGEDGRTVLLRLTKSGEELLQSAITAWHTAQERATALLGQTGVSMLHELTHSRGLIEGEA
jgi:DNA-binding MarR family transcriptional regulator